MYMPTLTATDTATAVRFYGDWDTDTTYPATGYDREWNGFAAPIVTVETFYRIISDSPGYSARARHTDTGDYVWTVDHAEPMDDGSTIVSHYADIPTTSIGFHLRNLGWTFDYAEGDDDN